MSDPLELKSHIRDIPDFPKPGIVFRDITPLLANPQAFGRTIDHLAEHFRDRGVTAVAAAEARGFLFATPLALKLNAAFVPVRKPGKLPGDVHSFAYELEYGTDSLEMHVDALGKDDRVVVVDDLLATGGTIEACTRMIEHSGAEVIACAFIIELGFLNGRDRLAGHEIVSLVQYDSED